MPLHVTFRKVKTRAAIWSHHFCVLKVFHWCHVSHNMPGECKACRNAQSEHMKQHIQQWIRQLRLWEVPFERDTAALCMRQLGSTTQKFMRTWRNLLLKFGRMLLDRIFRPAVERAVPRSHHPTFRGCRICVWTPTAFLRNMRDRP